MNDDAAGRSPVRNPLLRWALVAAGLVLTAVGIAGFVVPGLPGTPLLLLAAWLFSMSNDRLYRWMTTNRWFGQIVADYRAGLGIPRRYKVLSVVMVIVVVSWSAGFAIEPAWARILVVALGVYGVYFILSRPTRDAMVDRRGPGPTAPPQEDPGSPLPPA